MRSYGVALVVLCTAVGLGACDDDDEDSNRYEATLRGDAERPVVNTTATGQFTMTDNGATMSYVLTVNGITPPITGAHIHVIPRSGVAPADTTGPILINFNPPNNQVSTGILAQGSFSADTIRILSGSTTRMSFDSLRTLIDAGRAYVNVHNQANPGGHIRGTIRRAN